MNNQWKHRFNKRLKKNCTVNESQRLLETPVIHFALLMDVIDDYKDQFDGLEGLKETIEPYDTEWSVTQGFGIGYWIDWKTLAIGLGHEPDYEAMYVEILSNSLLTESDRDAGLDLVAQLEQEVAS